MDIYAVWELIALTILLYMGDKYSPPLGAAIYMLCSLPLQSAVLGNLFRSILQSPLYLLALVKPLSWLISSSGVLLGLGIHYFFWGVPDRPLEFWLVLIVAVRAVLKIFHSIITFDISYFDDFFAAMRNIPLFGAKDLVQIMKEEGGDEEFLKLSRSSFVDNSLPQFFQLLISVGVIYYCLGHLKIIPSVDGIPPNLLDSIFLSLSIMKITPNAEVMFYGEAWKIL